MAKSVEQLQAAIHDAHMWRIRRRGIIKATGWFTIGIGLLMALLTANLDFDRGPVMIAYVLFLVVMVVASVKWLPQKSSQINELWEADDPAVVGALIDAREMLHSAIYDEATNALTKLLPQMTLADAGNLNEFHRHSLRQYLIVNVKVILPKRFRNNPSEYFRAEATVDLSIAVLKAMETIGNRQDLNVVQSLATVKGSQARHPRIYEAAQACLPILLERSKNFEMEESFLRTSNAPENLLRSAANIDHSANELLRPSEELEARLGPSAD